MDYIPWAARGYTPRCWQLHTFEGSSTWLTRSRHSPTALGTKQQGQAPWGWCCPGGRVRAAVGPCGGGRTRAPRLCVMHVARRGLWPPLYRRRNWGSARPVSHQRSDGPKPRTSLSNPPSALPQSTFYTGSHTGWRAHLLLPQNCPPRSSTQSLGKAWDRRSLARDSGTSPPLNRGAESDASRTKPCTKHQPELARTFCNVSV